MTKKFDSAAVLKELKEIGHTINILIVEDELIAREQLHHMLSHFCCNIDLAENGLEALFLYQEKKHNLIITDLEMPEMSGIEMLREFQKFESDTKIIVTSGHNESDVLMELIQMGANGFIQKPFDLHKLLETLSKICHKIYEQDMNAYLNATLESINQELLKDTSLLKQELEQLKKDKVEPSKQSPITVQQSSVDTKEHQMIEIIHTHQAKMSAKEFYDTYPLELDKTNEDLEELENRLNHLILNTKRQEPERLIHEIITIISNYAKVIEMIPQFSSLAFAIQELTYTLESVKEKHKILLVLPMLGALVNNLDQWRLQIFFYQEVEDIHYMDNSILSDAMSLRAMLDDSSQSHSQQDEFEFF